MSSLVSVEALKAGPPERCLMEKKKKKNLFCGKMVQRITSILVNRREDTCDHSLFSRMPLAIKHPRQLIWKLYVS